MSEVSGPVCLAVVEEVATAGIEPDSESLVAGLPFGIGDLRAGAMRVRWDDFVVLLERAEARLGDLSAVTWTAAAESLGMELLRALAATETDARRIYALGCEWYGPSLFSSLTFRCADLRDRRLRLTVEILPAYRDCSAFFSALYGVLRRVPALLGQPAARVEVERSERRAVYSVTPPRPLGWWGRLRRSFARDSSGRLDAVARELGALSLEHRELAAAASEVSARLREQGRVLDSLGQLRQRALRPLELDSIADSIVDLFLRSLGFGGVIVWGAVLPSRQLRPIRQAGKVEGEAVHVEVLRVGERTVGRIDLWEGNARAVGREVIDPLLPWIGLLVDSAGASAAITRQSRRLEAATADRKRAENQLLQAQKMEAVGRLARGAAHEFNNILTIITGFADMALRRLETNSAARSQLEEIRIAGDRGAQLVGKLISFSRRRVIRPERLQLNDVIQRMAPMLSHVLGENIHLVLDLDAALPYIQADPALIEQVLVHLLENAREATPAGGTITIGTARSDGIDGESGSGDVRFWVEDHGRGMDAETRSRMFEPMYTTKAGGGGLGLTTVYNVVSQCGGVISVESALGEGTAVTIELPQDEEIPADGVPESAASSRGEGRSDAGGRDGSPPERIRILLVEDDPQIRELARQVLAEEGYPVIGASSGREALRLAEQSLEPIEVLVTDVVMPDMDGRELSQRLSELRPELRSVVYVSGHQDVDLGLYAPLPREAAFLRKPFTPARLVAAVRRALAGRPQRFAS